MFAEYFLDYTLSNEEKRGADMIFKSPEFHQVPLNRGKKSSSLVLPYYVPVSISTYTCDKDKIDTGYIGVSMSL